MYKVIRRFRDKETHNIYSVGDSYSHENEDRISSLVKKGFLEPKNKPPKEKKSPKKSKK